MKRYIFLFFLTLFSCLGVMAQGRGRQSDRTTPSDTVMTVEKGIYTVNTSSLCDARGFRGTTPLLVSFQKNKILSVKALANYETPRFFDRIAKELLPKFQNIEAAKAQDVDCITGATMSSKAVKANVEAAKDYYEKHSKKKDR